MTDIPTGTKTVVCAAHGLRYDPTVSDGCIRCRASGRPAAPTQNGGLAFVAVLIAGVGVIVLAVGFVVVRNRHVPVVTVESTESSNGVPVPPDDAPREPLPMEGLAGAALDRARTELDNYQLAEARAVLNQVLHDDPKNAIAYAYMARAAYRSGQNRDGTCDASAVALANEWLAKADALDPNLPDAMLARAYLHMFKNELKASREIGLTMEKKGLLPLRASLLIAQLDTLTGEYDDAERRATALIHSVRDGFVVDRAYDALDDVYSHREDEGAQLALRRIVLSRHGRDGRGRRL